MIPNGFEILLKTLQLILISIVIPVVLHGCCCQATKKKVGTPKKGTPQSSKSRTTSQKEDGKSSKKMDKTEKEVSDVQFNIEMKKKVSKYDEFDDDEENPLAKIPVVSRPKKSNTVKPSVSATPTPMTSTPNQKTTVTKTTTAKLGPRQESERPLFPMTDTGVGSSCYVNLNY